MVDSICNTDNAHLCLYRSWTWNVHGSPSKAQACMPKGGLNALANTNPGDIMQMGDKTKYQVIKCKFPECL